ncbi:MAG: hypothetical protein M1812_006624 [Candelaria pacifica]|nr:MAG: hypothetical protein M1812_006624 [Candelaria pacifica]
MARSNKPDHHLNLNQLPQMSASQIRSGSSTSNNTSPIEAPSGNAFRSPFASTNGLSTSGSMSASGRKGAGSPSLESGGRLYSKRAREIQAQEGLTPSVWGPPTSGNSTPLREIIPESPTGDGFPGFVDPSSESQTQTSSRRARAGTVPSRFSPASLLNGPSPPQHLPPKTSRPTPSTSPFRPLSASAADSGFGATSGTTSNANTTSALLSRLRSGSMPQRASYIGPSSPFGPSLFSTNWNQARERSTTLNSINSQNGPVSPAYSSFSKDGLTDTDVRTLDYLGLVDTPQQSRATLVRSGMETLVEGQRAAAMQPFIADLATMNKNLSRFRSYSVNAKEKYAEEEDEDIEHGASYPAPHSGSLTPSAASAAAALAATHAQIHQHNLAVQAFANQASASRPRARTAGVLESPQRSMRGYLATPSRLDNSISAADLRMADGRDYDGLPEAVQALGLGAFGRPTEDGPIDENNLEGPTRALWLGSIPSSTTVTSLNVLFKPYGPIESTRVLTYKNCGFVNFEHVESAISAKNLLSGKELFPGNGPIRIGYAKAPTASTTGTPGHQGTFSSPSPDPFLSNRAESKGVNENGTAGGSAQLYGSRPASAAPKSGIFELQDMQNEMLGIVREFGASEDDQIRIQQSIQQAIRFEMYEPEIPAVPEPSPNRLHDAPRLRDTRKRIDNSSCSQAEIEEIAMGMLPEIAELSSDYLGNTVVQKLFEFCSEDVKEAMLNEITPHLAEIGAHKNGTWAAQKIIDVARTPSQMSVIVDSLRPYTVPLFLDQYGNYVLQCSLRFGHPWNNFIFETMLTRMWDVAQGRFGARAMRACLESHHATKDQQRMLAAAIALNSVQLATDPNGALLLTWFLDTCTFPRRRTVLAPRLVPHLVQLCTHKVAYLTVLKVINQRNEPDARDIVLKALFFSENDNTLEDILSDQACGATLIFKVLTTPFFDENLRSDVVQNVRNVLTRLKAQPSQGYKRLMDEVGLSTRGGAGRDHHNSRDGINGHMQVHERQRPGSQHGSTNPHTPQPHMERQYSGQYFPNAAPQSFDANAGMARSGSLDPNGLSAFEQFGLNGVNSPMFTPNPQASLAPMSQQQMQYQAILAASARGAMSPGSFYPGMAAIGLGGYATPSPSIDNFRNVQAHNSPIGHPPAMSHSPMMQQSGFAPPAFNPLMAGQMMGGYQYPLQFMPQQQQQQQQQPQQQSNGRRGRVSIPSTE